jgi:hypothetical protein
MTRTTLHAQVRESLTRGIQTRDALLTPPTESELRAWQQQTCRMAAHDPGKLWAGAYKPMLDAMSPATRNTILKQIDAYGRQASYPAPNDEPAGGTEATADSALRGIASNIDFISGLNAAARKRWGQG